MSSSLDPTTGMDVGINEASVRGLGDGVSGDELVSIVTSDDEESESMWEEFSDVEAEGFSDKVVEIRI
ncbi:hypothetical protein HK097_003560, partial [Rhizophlyctis rosea]